MLNIQSQRILFIIIFIISLITPPLLAIQIPLSPALTTTGIDVIKLHSPPYNLTGKKIAIGQVEIGRPGYFGLDKSYSTAIQNNLQKVFYRDNSPKINTGDPHAAMVAAIMVSHHKYFKGVAPNAQLYSTAVGSPKVTKQPEECLSLQFLSQQNNGNIKAINLSFGEALNRDTRDKPILDGNALLTQCIDWLSRVNDIVYVVAGNQGKGGIPIPTDNYNGVNVAFSMPRNGVFSKVDFSNLSIAPFGIGKRLLNREINENGRIGINLLAPGKNVPVIDQKNQINYATGTSYAAPHVTATVALLQEYSKKQNLKNYHEIIKAILINSADKIQDQGDGKFLEMTKTMLTKNHRNWLNTEAYKNQEIPLDYELGSGQLNAYRAYLQYSNGEQKYNLPVNNIGWNYDDIKLGEYQDYILDKPLEKGSFIAATLVWDRLVELTDKNINCQYDIGETFTDKGLNNLDLYLMKAEDNDINNSLWSSRSNIDNIEHIFHEIPSTGKYKLRVYFTEKINNNHQKYALTWWSQKKY
jgi:Subtilase family